MREIRDLKVSMRDEIELSIDVFLPDDPSTPVPALVGMSPYGKDIQSLDLPPQPPTSPIYAREIEAGDPKFLTDHGYAHVIADVRGIGNSGGTYRGWLSEEEAFDGHDLIEWVADQEWCSGKVGMVGVSYFGAVQLHVAATKPPHLKAIMPFNAPADFYRESTHHGGILQIFYHMLYQLKVLGRWESVTVESSSAEELEEIKRTLYEDPGIRMYQALYNIAKNPERNPGFFDIMSHPLDGEFYWSRSPNRHYQDVTVPAYLGSGWWAYGHQHLRGAFENYLGLPGFTKLYIESRVESPAPMGEDYNQRVVRWYDHWLKDIDTGIEEEAPIEIEVRGKGTQFESEWPLSRTEWKSLYLGRWGILRDNPENNDSGGDIFVQQPIVYTSEVARRCYETVPLTENIDVIGPIAMELYASIDSTDTNWIVSLSDVAPNGTPTELTRGFLKASHRAVDEERSTPWMPYHLHTDPEPVQPGAVYQYRIQLSPMASRIFRGHKLRLCIASLDHKYDPAPDLEIGGPSHMPTHVGIAETVKHEVLFGDLYPSHLLIPVV